MFGLELNLNVMGLILIIMASMIIILGGLFVVWSIRHIRAYEFKSKLIGGCTIAMGSFMISLGIYGLYLIIRSLF